MSLNELLAESCHLTSIGDQVIAYSYEALVILYGLLMLLSILGIIWLIKFAWEKIIDE